MIIASSRNAPAAQMRILGGRFVFAEAPIFGRLAVTQQVRRWKRAKGDPVSDYMTNP